jgi:hypothetical protein
VSTNRLNEQYRRNVDRFPGDFAFQLKPDEWAALRSQIATLNIDGSMWSQFATASKRNIRHLPVVFTEHGALMAANILILLELSGEFSLAGVRGAEKRQGSF